MNRQTGQFEMVNVKAAARTSSKAKDSGLLSMKKSLNEFIFFRKKKSLNESRSNNSEIT
jgi:molybdenum cofactor biosynthesis enzyme